MLKCGIGMNMKFAKKFEKLKTYFPLCSTVFNQCANIRVAVISRQREHFAYTADIYPLVLAASYKQHNSREFL